jgi:thymidylate kinase
MRPEMFPAFLLFEGIDGSGKDTLVQMLAEEIRVRFAYHPERSLSIVGQPRFVFDDTGLARALIEGGRSDCSFEQAVAVLSESRRRHEAYLDRYGGFTLCIRGLLTELATLERLYGRRGEMSQRRPIERLVIVDVDPALAWERIRERGGADSWRETPENLNFFREWLLGFEPTFPVGRVQIVRNHGDLHALRAVAVAIAEELLTSAPEA